MIKKDYIINERLFVIYNTLLSLYETSGHNNFPDEIENEIQKLLKLLRKNCEPNDEYLHDVDYENIDLVLRATYSNQTLKSKKTLDHIIDELYLYYIQQKNDYYNSQIISKKYFSDDNFKYVINISYDENNNKYYAYFNLNYERKKIKYLLIDEFDSYEEAIIYYHDLFNLIKYNDNEDILSICYSYI